MKNEMRGVVTKVECFYRHQDPRYGYKTYYLTITIQNPATGRQTLVVTPNLASSTGPRWKAVKVGDEVLVRGILTVDAVGYRMTQPKLLERMPRVTQVTTPPAPQTRTVMDLIEDADRVVELICKGLKAAREGYAELCDIDKEAAAMQMALQVLQTKLTDHMAYAAKRSAS